MTAALIGLGIEAAKAFIDKKFPDATVEEKAKLEIYAKELDAQMQANLAQAEINKIEAQSQSLFVSGWRPFIGWVCGAAIAFTYLIYPLLVWAKTNVPPDKVNTEILFELIVAMLGLGGLRTAEKITFFRKK